MASDKRHKNSNFHVIFILIGLLTSCGLIDFINSVPVENVNRRKYLSSLTDRLDLEEIGNPSELAWQAWLLVDDQKKSNRENFDSASLLRRITPKSIFIAPPLSACAEDYKPGATDKCVKNVNINQEAHIDFLLQRLNAMYANFGNQPNSELPSASAGPLQVNIPLFIDTDQTGKTDEKHSNNSKDENTEKKNENSENKKNTTLIIYDDIENKSTGFEQLIPIMEFIEEIDLNNATVIDYKTSTVIDEFSSKTPNNSSINENDFVKEEELNISDSKLNSQNDSIHLNLLLSLPSMNLSMVNVKEDIRINNISSKRVTIDLENKRNEPPNEQIMEIKFPTIIESPKNSTQTQPVFNVSIPLDNNTTVETGLYDNEYSTEFDKEKDKFVDDHTEDYEESTENDEILNHSEAGSITSTLTKISNFHLPHTENKQTKNKISGKVTVNKDFIRETTFVGLNIFEINNNDTNVNKTSNPDSNNNNNTNGDNNNNNDDDDDNDNDDDDNTNNNNLNSTEETMQWNETSNEAIKETTETLPTFFSPIMNNTSMVSFSVDTFIKGTLNEKSGQKKTFMRSSITPDVALFKDVGEIAIFPDKFNSLTSRTITASSSDTVQTFLPQKLINSDVENDTKTRKSHKKMVNSQEIEIGFPSSTIELNTHNYQKFLQDYSNNPQSTFDKNELLTKPTSDLQTELESRDNEYIKFPAFGSLPSRPNYGRFPFNEANSIYVSNDFKDKTNDRQYPQQIYHLILKQPYRPILPNHRFNQQQLSQKLALGYQNEKKKQNRSSPILGFWTRLPFLQDPTLLQQPTHPFLRNVSDKEETKTNVTKRIGYHEELASLNITRPYARSTLIKR